MPTTKHIYCYEENKIYKSADEFAQAHQLKHTTGIYKVCSNVPHNLTVRGLHVFWYDEFCSLTDEQIQMKISKKQRHPSSMPVVLLETGEKFDSIKQAAREKGVNDECIRLCCHHKAQYTKLKDGTKGHWMFYDEYLINKEQKI